MSYLVISSFQQGLDSRKFKLSQPPGTLLRCINAHIDAGGEIEKRKAFVLTNAPVGVFGAQATLNTIYTFGSAIAPSLPSPFGYFRLQHPAVINGTAYDASKHAMTSVVWSDLFGAYPFVIAKFADGYSFAYYCSPDVANFLVTDFTAGIVLPYMTTNTAMATEFAQIVNETVAYSAISSGASADVQNLPGSTYAVAITVESNLGGLTSVEQNAGQPGISGVQAIGHFSVNGGSAAAGTNKVTVVTVGATRAFQVLTSDNTNVSNNDTVTVGGVTYTFKTVLTPTSGEVLIGASADKSLANLIDAINFTGFNGTTYVGTSPNSLVVANASVIAHALTVYAIAYGTVGNAIASTESSTHLAWGAVTLTNGTDSTSLLSAAVDFVTNNNATAAAIAANIAANSATSKFTATATNNIVSIMPVLSNSFENTASVTVTAAGNVVIGNCALLFSLAAKNSTSDITSVAVDTATITTAAVVWNTDITTTLADLVANINANTGTSGYIAFKNGNTLYLSKVVTASTNLDSTVVVALTSTGIIVTGSNSGIFTALATPSSATCNKLAPFYFSPSALVTCSVSGGISPYTFLWERAGAEGFYVAAGKSFATQSSAQSVTFRYIPGRTSSKTGIYQCTATDSTGKTAVTTVALTAK